MRRFWLLAMALAMLGQWSYAVAGAYCSHEGVRSPAAMHWGHHVHSHADPKAGQESPGSKKSLGQDGPDAKKSFDSDCAFCHAGGAFSPLHVPALDAASSGARLSAATALQPASRSPGTPERPQWRRPALA